MENKIYIAMSKSLDILEELNKREGSYKDEVINVGDLAKGVAILVKKEFGSHNVEEFLSILQEELK